MATATTTVSGDIPSVLEPFYVGDAGLIERGIANIFPGQLTGTAAFERMNQPLIQAGLAGAGQIAPMSQFQQQVGQRLAGLQSPAATAQAQQFGQTAAGAYQSIPGVAAPELTQFQLGAPTYQEVAEYMSPYMQGVVDIQQRRAIDAARQAQLSQNLGAARQGTYGGARQAILESQREAGLRTQLGDIQAQGLQSAFDQAQQLRQRTAEQNLAAALGVQQLGAGQSLEAQRANQAAQLQGAAGLGQLAQTMGGLGTQQLAGELDILKTQGAYGDLQRAIEQQQRDAQARYLQDMSQYGLTQVGQLSNLLRGVPLSDTTQTQTTPPPSFASQLTGLGLTGIGLYNLMQGGK